MKIIVLDTIFFSSHKFSLRTERKIVVIVYLRQRRECMWCWWCRRGFAMTWNIFFTLITFLVVIQSGEIWNIVLSSKLQSHHHELNDSIRISQSFCMHTMEHHINYRKIEGDINSRISQWWGRGNWRISEKKELKTQTRETIIFLFASFPSSIRPKDSKNISKNFFFRLYRFCCSFGWRRNERITTVNCRRWRYLPFPNKVKKDKHFLFREFCEIYFHVLKIFNLGILHSTQNNALINRMKWNNFFA